MMGSDFFATAGFWLQAFLAIVGCLTLYVYYRQLRVMNSQLKSMQASSQAQGFLSLVAFVQAPEIQSSRKIVRSVLSGKHHGNWSEEECSHASIVCANYDVLAALLRADETSQKFIVVHWGPSIKHCFEILTPFIDKHRNMPGANASYWSNFSWLYQQVSLHAQTK